MKLTIAMLGACALMFGCTKAKEKETPESDQKEQTAPADQGTQQQAPEGQEQAPVQKMEPGEGGQDQSGQPQSDQQMQDQSGQPQSDQSMDSSGAQEQAGQQAEGTIVDAAMADPKLTMFVSLLTEAEMVDALRGTGPYTVFAPSDEAFSKLSKETLDSLKADKAKLASVLKHHVVKQSIPTSQLEGMKSIQPMDGPALKISTEAGGFTVDGAKVEQPDIRASNGVIHVIDKVLVGE